MVKWKALFQPQIYPTNREILRTEPQNVEQGILNIEVITDKFLRFVILLFDIRYYLREVRVFWMTLT